MPIVSNMEVVSRTRLTHSTHVTYQKRGNSTRGKEARLVAAAEASSFRLCGTVAARQADWAQVLNAIPVLDGAAATGSLRKLATQHRSIRWKLKEVDRWVRSRTDAAPKVDISSTEDAVSSSTARFRAAVDESTGWSRATKRVHRSRALDDLTRVLVGVRVTSLVARHPEALAESHGGLCHLLLGGGREQ